MKPKQFTLEEHIENANDLAIAAHHLNKIFERCQENFGKSHRMTNLLLKITPGNGHFLSAQNEFEKLLHQNITDEDFNKHGNTYCNLHKRYDALSKS